MYERLQVHRSRRRGGVGVGGGGSRQRRRPTRSGDTYLWAAIRGVIQSSSEIYLSCRERCLARAFPEAVWRFKT